MPPLQNYRDELVAQSLAAGKSKTQACVDAGFKKDRGNASKRTAKHSIKQRVAEIQAERVQHFVLNRAWVTEMLVENVKRAMQTTAVKNEDGKPIGQFHYNGSVANKSLELLGKELGMFADRSEVKHSTGEYDKLSDVQLVELLVQEARALLEDHSGETAGDGVEESQESEV